ncbi:MAG: hypothetical protein M1818_000260 [Claussenomyces sp. TS43310]|nr:MAG: hypothetical protein M1818_000260 [Claussenomyces sp. TS43310]
MSLGSRIAQRGKAVISVSSPSLASTPREPLLFLYPRWIRTAASVNAGDRDGGRSTAIEVHVKPASPQTSAPITAGAERAAFLESHRLTDELPDGVETDVPSEHTTSVDDDTNARHGKQESTIRTNPRKSSSQPQIATLVSQIVRTARRSEARTASKTRFREKYQERARAKRETTIIDWRKLLRDLEMYTPVRSATWHDNALRIKVPNEKIGQFLFGLDDNIWKIKDRCGAHIELTNAWDDDRNSHALILSGPVTAVAKASAEIMQLSTKGRVDKPDSSTTSSHFNTRSPPKSTSIQGGKARSTSLVRHVRAERRLFLASPKKAEAIPRPSTWTTSSFGEYVLELVNTKVTGHLARFLYGPQETHQDVVMGILRELFEDKSMKAALSTSAFNEAITFFVKCNQMEDVRRLYVHMELQNLRMDTETYNIMLRGAAKTKDLYNFRFILNLMLKRGYKPNPRTWIAFLMALQGRKTKLHVLASMASRGLIYDTSVKKEVCEQLVLEEINGILDLEGDQAQFLAHMDERYGKDWLSVSSSNRVLTALSTRGLISACWDFMLAMRDRGIKLTTVTLHTVLHNCEQQRNMKGAVEIIHRASAIQTINLEHLTYETLFRTAWHHQLYIVAKVVWQYACLEAKTTYTMRKMLHDYIALSRQVPASNASAAGLQKGKIWPLVGKAATPNADTNETFVGLTPFGLPVRGSRRRWDRASPSNMVYNDLAVFKEWKATKRFGEALMEALELERAVEKGLEMPAVDIQLRRRAPESDSAHYSLIEGEGGSDAAH